MPPSIATRCLVVHPSKGLCLVHPLQGPPERDEEQVRIIAEQIRTADEWVVEFASVRDAGQ